MLRTLLIATGMCGLLGACTTIDASKDRVDATYFGIVRVEAPAVAVNAATSGAGPGTAIDTHAFGLRIQSGIGVGCFHDQTYQVPPDSIQAGDRQPRL